jgi:hypothetical protein
MRKITIILTTLLLPIGAMAQPWVHVASPWAYRDAVLEQFHGDSAPEPAADFLATVAQLRYDNIPVSPIGQRADDSLRLLRYWIYNGEASRDASMSRDEIGLRHEEGAILYMFLRFQNKYGAAWMPPAGYRDSSSQPIGFYSAETANPMRRIDDSLAILTGLASLSGVEHNLAIARMVHDLKAEWRMEDLSEAIESQVELQKSVFHAKYGDTYVSK